MDFAAARIDQSKCIHAADPPQEAFQSPLLKTVDQHLGIGSRSEVMPRPFQFRAQLEEIVDLSVEDDLNGPVLVGHGLTSRIRKVDDRKPAMAQRKPRAGDKTAAVGPARRHGVAHPHDPIPVDLGRRHGEICRRFRTLNNLHPVLARFGTCRAPAQSCRETFERPLRNTYWWRMFLTHSNPC